jgi:hypothetical protein
VELAVAMVRPLPTRAIISLAVLRVTSAPTFAICIKHIPVLALVNDCVAEEESAMVRVCTRGLGKLTPMVSRRVGEMHSHVISLSGILSIMSQSMIIPAVKE